MTLTLFVRTVDEESFEVEEIEGRRGQELELAFHLLLSWLFTIIFGSLGLGGSSSGLGLLLRLDDGFDSFLGHLNLSEDGDELGKSRNARKPGASLGGGFCEALVENKLEGYRQG